MSEPIIPHDPILVVKAPACDSPLPAWKHYRLIHAVDQSIQQKLSKTEDQDEYLTGLEVAYCLGNPEIEKEMEYTSISFGNVEFEEPRDYSSALDEDFLNGLFEDVSSFIKENVPRNETITGIKMTVKTSRRDNLNGIIAILSSQCLLIGSSYLRLPVKCSHVPAHSGNRWCNRNWAGTAWKCTSKACQV